MTIEDELSGIPQSFRDFLSVRGLVYDPVTQVDLLASALSSQFLLFAGPSGTGKSTAARVLAEFLTPASRSMVIDARRSWTSSEDLVGQYSSFTGDFVKGPYTDNLRSLGESDSAPPIITIEEANLSPMEGYLGPVISGASSVAFRELEWRLHDVSVEPGAVPQIVNLAPWPRVFGTINVDSTAAAPAPKVSGRACVVLLEPPDVDTALASTDALTAVPIPDTTPLGAALFRDPRNAWFSYLTESPNRFTDALKPLLEVIGASTEGGLNLVTPRDVQRCVVYMGWHAPLSEAAVASNLVPATSDRESAENALLHFVLPGLSSDHFERALGPLAATATPGGMLARRLTRLSGGGESLFGVLPDFWASLS